MLHTEAVYIYIYIMHEVLDWPRFAATLFPNDNLCVSSATRVSRARGIAFIVLADTVADRRVRSSFRGGEP